MVSSANTWNIIGQFTWKMNGLNNESTFNLYHHNTWLESRSYIPRMQLQHLKQTNLSIFTVNSFFSSIETYPRRWSKIFIHSARARASSGCCTKTGEYPFRSSLCHVTGDIYGVVTGLCEMHQLRKNGNTKGFKRMMNVWNLLQSWRVVDLLEPRQASGDVLKVSLQICVTCDFHRVFNEKLL